MTMIFSDFYTSHVDLNHHWCSLSESYAGVDILLCYIDAGWKIEGDIGFDEHWFGGARHILVYHFSLIKKDDHITMAVLSNPVLDRFLKDCCRRGVAISRIIYRLGRVATKSVCE